MKMKSSLPDNAEKYIILDDDGNEKNGKIVILIGYCPDSLPYFKYMLKEALSSGFNIDEREAICTKVKESSRKNGFTMMMIPFSNEDISMAIENGFKKSDLSILDIKFF